MSFLKRFKTSQDRKINGHTVFNPRNSIRVIPNGPGGYIARGKIFNNWTSNNEFIDQVIRNCQTVNLDPDIIVEWIPFENFKDVNFKTKGGFGSIYTAVWSDGWILDWDEKSSKLIRTGAITVVLKSLDDFIKLNDENLEEVISNLISNLGSCGVKCYGLTKNPDSSKYLLVLKYMENGDLESCLLDKNKEFNWKEIYSLLQQIFKQLHALHNSNMVHRDLHPGNILSDQEKWFISDFGFCGPSDIYSMGVIMWQLVTRKNPYAEFTDAFGILDPSSIIILDPPNIIGLSTTYERMMKKCLDPNSEQRPYAQELFGFFDKMLGQISN
ncbi:26019_t:CDS:2, partial [Gigaspora rosea]